MTASEIVERVGEIKPPVAAQPLYPHTLAQPPESTDLLAAPPTERVDIDALAALYARSTSAVLYLDRVLSDTDSSALFDKYQLMVEFDAVRGVDAVRQAAPGEFGVVAP